MFRIFLKKKLESGEITKDAPNGDGDLKPQDRRVHERFSVDQKHLTVMNDQDILVIRDISVKGFCSDVSDRAYERFTMDDVFEARMRSHGEIRSIMIKVAWKREKAVGFELHNADTETLVFFRDLVKPYKLASSLRPVETNYTQNEEGRVWYHGEDVDLHIWMLDGSGISAWQLIADSQLIEWSANDGIRTGVIKYQGKTELGIREQGEPHHVMDAKPDLGRVRLASEIFAASSLPEYDELDLTLQDFEGAEAV